MVLLLVLLFGGYRAKLYTDSDHFCASCHEIKQSHETFLASKHNTKGIRCVSCHIAPGVLGQVKGKLVGIREVYRHVRGQIPEQIALSQSGLEALNASCLDCHRRAYTRDPQHVATSALAMMSYDKQTHRATERVLCTHCHIELVHGEKPEFQIAKYVRTPEAPSDFYRDHECFGCHLKISPGQVVQWALGEHAQAGVSCADCHGLDHMDLSGRKGRVSSAKCGTCHPQQAKEFAASKHRVAMDTLEKNARYLALPKEIRLKSCVSCHKIGEYDEWDGSRGRCDSCHRRHAFSSADAACPRACGRCHSGAEQPQYESYLFSKHTVLEGTMARAARKPSCDTCHMAGRNHNVSLGIAHDLAGEPLPPDEFKQRREQMAAQCMRCHSKWFVDADFKASDAIVRQSRGILDKARSAIEQAEADGLLAELLKNAKPNPVTGKLLELGPNMLVAPTDPRILQEFFRLKQVHFAGTWKAAYHNGPDYLRTRGWEPLNQSCQAILDEVKRLREQKR